MNNLNTLTSIARRILDENLDASLTGSLMLKLRGIDLDREPGDIDILIRDYAPNITFPIDMIVEQIGQASNGEGAKYKYEDIIIDVISGGEEPDLIDGLRLGTVEELLNNKYSYSLQDNENAKKHHDDLVRLGFNFPDIDNEENSLFKNN